MFKVSQKEFESIVKEAVENLPQTHRDKMQNIAFFVRSKPSKKQIDRSNLKPGSTLFGLYEGIPLSSRNGATSIIPDTITIFQEPIEQSSRDQHDLKRHIKHTVWHEVAHYFGLDHTRINSIEDSYKP